ncbi:MAG: nucleoside-diphosphate sugar epimerase/dehydratase [Rhodospirillaceae bacterium]
MKLGYLTIGRASFVYIHDLVMSALAVVIALYLRVGDDAFGPYFAAMQPAILLAVVIATATFRLFGLYRGIWRYASALDMVQVIKAVSVSTALFALLTVVIGHIMPLPDPLPRSVPLIFWLVLVTLLAGPRFGYRLLKDERSARRAPQCGQGSIPVLLIGVSDAAALFISSLVNEPHAPYRVVGVLDEKDRGRRVGRDIRGVPVLGSIDQLVQVVDLLNQRGQRPHRLVLAKSQAELPGGAVRALLDQAEGLGLQLTRLPSMLEFKEALGEGKIELRPIAIEDLLGRPQAVLNRSAIRGLIAGRRVLVTGAGGTIGSELSRQIAALGPSSLVLVENGEFNLYSIDMELRERFPALNIRAIIADVRNCDRILRLFQESRPEMVFHAAALKHVPLVEECAAEGVLTNVIGTRNVADAARSVGVRAMVLISTDKAVRPSSVMGATKRIAEAYCQALDTLAVREALAGTETPTRFVTVRFGNVLGSSGSVVPLFRRQLARGGPITVTHPDMRRYFMTVRESVELVLQASAHGLAHPDERGCILVLDMGEPVRIVDMARQMILLSGHKPDIDIKIEYIGMRPGEKLFEEILYAAEKPSRTEADGVFLASPQVLDFSRLNCSIGELETAAAAGCDTQMVDIIRRIVPEYRAMVGEDCHSRDARS